MSSINMRRVFALLVLPVSALIFGCSSSSNEDPATTQNQAWDAESVDNEANSTHLWIVNHAIKILAKHTDDARLKATVDLLNKQSCRDNWQQGLLDADFKHEYNNGRVDFSPGASDAYIIYSGATWESHFFDPDTGLNWKDRSDPTAYTQAMRHLDSARENVASDEDNACYELGLSLHYMTDLTQPMHAANFTAVSRPKKMHSNVEGWAMGIQDEFPLADWSGPSEKQLSDFIIDTAKLSKTSWGTIWSALADAYRAAPNRVVCGDIEAPAWKVWSAQEFDHTSCWENDEGVKAAVGQSLKNAQDWTAQYLAIVGPLR
jgi:phospholipase C